MKRIFLTMILFSTLLVGNSCKHILDTQPEDFVSPEDYYNTEDDLNRSLSGVYRMLATDPLYANYLPTFMSLGDEFFYRPTNAQTGANVLDISSSESNINGFWVALYQGVQRANLLLENVNKPVMDEKKREVIKGEALFLRAYFYFLLVDYFGEVPLRLIATKSPVGTSLKRSSIKEIYEQIVKDMKEAEGLVLPMSSYSYNGHITKTAVQGILAKVYLTMAGFPLKDASKYEDALYYADLVMKSGLHSLNPSYQQIFINHSQEVYDTKECIWEIEFSGDNTGIIRAAGRIGIVNGILSAGITSPGYSGGQYNATKRLYDYYNVGDLRRDWNIANIKYTTPAGTTITSTEGPVTTTVIYDRQIGKWRRKYEKEPRSQNFNGTNFPILRYSDVLLMYAEAYNQINGLGDGKAYQAVNQVSRRAFGLPVNVAATSVTVVNTLTLLSAGNTGYLPAIATVPITFTGGGGSGATGLATIAATGKVTAITMVSAGSGYTSAPTVVIGTAWTANTEYAAGIQVFFGNNLYTITKTGTTTSTAPTNTTGSSLESVTGAVFTYAGVRATATATIATSAVDFSGFTQQNFLERVIMPERARELAFEAIRLHDLKRWDEYINAMAYLKTDILSASSTTFHYAATAAGNVSARNKFLPIPNSELSINNLATQNLGW